MENEEPSIFIDGVDADTVSTEIQRHLNAIYSYSTHLVQFKYYFLIYKIVKKGYMSMDQIMEVTGLKSNRIYKIISDLEEREKRRQGSE